MTDRLNAALQRLDERRLAEVADFAESLARRQDAVAEPVPHGRTKNMSWVGLAAHLDSDLDSVELMHEATASRGDL